MRMMSILMAICGGLLASAAGSADGGEEATSRAGTAKARVFNVLRYGAVGDDKADNTQAFSACLKAVVEAGGGRMILPDGVYRGRIVIPAVSKPLSSWITVEIAGESEPTPVFGTIGSCSLLNNGTIVKSLAESGDAVIRAQPPSDSLYGGFSAVNVVIRNLDVRTCDDPRIGGIDLHHAVQCKLENVFVNTGVYNVQAAKPTHRTSGLITPACNNAALTVLRNLVVTGYHTGIQVNEHTDGDNVVVASNINGLEFVQAHHASRFARVGAYRNTHHVTVSGRHGFSIEQMNTEQPGPGQTDARNAWQTLASDVEDPQNLGVADINYWVVVGNVGARDTFVKKGGASIRARRIGSAPARNESTSVEHGRVHAQSSAGEKNAVDAPGEIHEEPVDSPTMDEVQSLRKHVALCEQVYKRSLARSATGAKGGDSKSVLEVRYGYLLARAKLRWAESEWADCRKESAALVRTAKTLLLVVSTSYEPDWRSDAQVAAVEASAKLTEARILLAKATAKEEEMKASTKQ